MLTFQKKISKEEVNELPLKAFEGPISLIDDARDLEEAVSYLEKFPILGFDTETKPAFKKGVFYDVALLQLSTSEKSFLFRINRIGLPQILVDLLANRKIIKVGAAIKDDVVGLQKISSFRAGGFVELQDFVGKYGIESFSLKKLSVSAAQKKYAATDAWVSLEVYEELLRNK